MTPTARGDAQHRISRHLGVWLESSWDLRSGLTVREGLPDDAGLDEWIAAALRAETGRR